MNSDTPDPEARKRSPTDEEELQQMRRDVFSRREFTLADVIAREGGSFLKGESPIPKLVQLKGEINGFIRQNLPDASGALQTVLYRWVDEDTARISRHLDAPLRAFSGLLESILGNPSTLHELVRQVDMLWGEMNSERPHFQRPGQPPHPDDEYTHESVYQQLVELSDRLQSELDKK